MNFKITRKEVVLKNVPYYGMASDGIGYIKLTNFMENASKDVKNALVELKAKNEVKSLILDLRGNPGGLLNEAVDICNLFLPRGQIVVSTKGKIKEMQKEHITSNNPEDLNIPIVVLVNGSSASASEIVSGALQDYDRAVVLGGRTFGKGLVQTTKSLPFNTTLKLTTAKYYIPSGRCIQAINYAEKNPDGSVKKVPDSLKKEFFTVNKRKVYDGGGIEPDIKTKPEYIKSLELELIGKGIIDDYAIRYVINNPKPLNAKSYQFKENEYANFVSFAKAHSDFKYQTPVEKQIEALKKTAEEENSSEVKEDIEMLESKLKSIRLKEFEKLKTSIMELIQFKIVEKYFYQSGVIENSFQFDKDIQEATKLLNNSAEYKKILK
jgi:carboxyl-terminal processing protease